MPIHNRLQADALTRIIHVIRQTRGHGHADWHEKAIENTLSEGRHHPAPYPEIVVALTRYAKDSDKRVPSFLWDALADWHAPGTTAPRNPCEDHPEQDARTCACCWSDVKTGMRPTELVGRHHDIADTLDTAMTPEDHA